MGPNVPAFIIPRPPEAPSSLVGSGDTQENLRPAAPPGAATQQWKDREFILEVADAPGDVTVLINNAGTSASSLGILTHSDEEIRANVETNFLKARLSAPIEAVFPQLTGTKA